MDSVFQNFDTNKDGVLSWDEVWTSMKPLLLKVEKKIFAWKATPDMSTDDFKLMVREMFEAADENND